MNELAMAKTEFQGTAEVLGQIPSGLKAMLSTQAFPTNGPVSLEEARNYGGEKLFCYEGRLLCFSHYDYRGARDDYGRAVASASILVAPVEFLRYRRHYGFLAEYVQTWLAPAELAQAFEQAQPNLACQTGLGALAKAGFPLSQLPSLLAYLCNHQRLVVGGKDSYTRGLLLQMLFTLLPIEVVARMSWSTYGDFLSEDQEQVLSIDLPVIPPARGLFAQIRTRWLGVKDQVGKVDATSGQLDFSISLDGREKQLAALFAELIATGGIPAEGGPSNYEVLQDLLSYLVSQRLPTFKSDQVPEPLKKWFKLILR